MRETATFDEDEDTVRARMPSVSEITLDAVLDTLARVEPSPRERELRARAEAYRLTLAQRSSVRPTPTQRMALRELVAALHEAVVSSVDRGTLAARKNVTR